jgi:hypothetical protein
MVAGWPTPGALCMAAFAAPMPFIWNGCGPIPRTMKLPFP